MTKTFCRIVAILTVNSTVTACLSETDSSVADGDHREALTASAAGASSASEARLSDSDDAVSLASDSEHWVIFPISASDRCLEVQGGSESNGAQVQIWRHRSNEVTPKHHRWTFRNTSNHYVRLINEKSKKCANIKGSTDRNGTKIIQYTCGDSETLNDQWFPDRISEGLPDLYLLRSRLNYDKCLNVQGDGRGDGTDLILYTCGGGADNEAFSWLPARLN
jgi:hypothetical protein